MNGLDDRCREIEGMDPDELSERIATLSAKIADELEDFSTEEVSGKEVCVFFMMTAISADGAMNRKEYQYVSPAIEALFGEEVTFEGMQAEAEEGVKLLEDSGSVVGFLDDIAEQTSNDVRDDIIQLTILISAVDGMISDKEKDWIGKLMG